MEVEDWPEFQCVWKDRQHIKAKIPASGARRVACMRSGGGWKRCTEANLENITPKTTKNYKRVLEVFEAVETAVTRLTNLDALLYIYG